MPTPGLLRPQRLPAEDEVHIWTVLVSDYSSSLLELQSLLSAEEKRIAARFVYAPDRTRYAVAHGLLRRLLGEYLSLPPADLTFVVGEYGKPALARTSGQPPLGFNLAHSDNAIVYGVTLGRRVGVDVEAVRPTIDVTELARSQFSKIEANALTAFPLPERVDAFFRCWTRKEAYLKARGDGLSYPLAQFAVSLEIGRPEILWVADETNGPEKWSMFHLNSPAGYAGAAVVEGRPIRLVSHGAGMA